MKRPGSRPSILLVDGPDEPRERVAAALTEAGLDVRRAGPDELAEDRLEAVDGVVAAHDPPSPDGLELLRTVRESTTELPVVLLDRTGETAVAAAAVDAGVTEYVEGRPDGGEIGALVDRIDAAVTDHRRRLEHRETARRMDLALAATDSGTWEWDLETGEVVWDERLEAMLGIEPGGFGGTFEAHAEYLHPEDRSLVESAAGAALEGDGEFHEEFRMVREDGETIWVEGRGQRFSIDDGDRMVGLTRNISDRKASERALEESEERYRQLLATAPAQILVYAPNGDIRYANDAAVEFLGAEDRSELLGRNVLDLVDADIRPVVEERMARVIEAGERLPAAEETLVDLQGEPKQVIVASAPIRFRGERAIQAVATDVTELKAREVELERQVERLDEFASIISHDLRNPLSVAVGRLELARERPDDEDLERAAEALDRMEVLIDDLLALARHGGTVSDAEPVELARTGRGCWNTVSTESAVLDIDTDAVVLADEGRLRQVLENLIGNAVEHAGPDVTVTVGDLDDGFFVEDDGPGIPVDRREAVFEHGHSTKSDGGGFGLTIVEQIADAHDWDVRVATGTHGGARIEITGVEPVEG